MTDPFSITAGAVGIIDVCYKIGVYLYDVQKAAEGVEGEIIALSREIEDLISVNESIKEVSKQEQRIFSSHKFADQQHLKDLWQRASTLQKGCRDVLDMFEQILRDILGKDRAKVTGKIDGIRKQLRKQSKDGQLSQIRLKLSTYQDSLQTLLSVLNL